MSIFSKWFKRSKRASTRIDNDLTQQVTELANEIVEQQTEGNNRLSKVASTLENLTEIMGREGVRLHNGRS